MFAPSVMWGMTKDGLAELAQYSKKRKVPITMHLLEIDDDDEEDFEDEEIADEEDEEFIKAEDR